MIGFRRGTREWSTVPGPDVVAVPELVGTLGTGARELADAAVDFGHQVHRRPLAVLRPGNAADVAAIVRFGRENGLTVVPRGEGHSVDGQAQVRDGIVVDMSALAEIGERGPDRISVAAGARWSAVLGATLPYGTAPPVVVDYLEMSVGGTLSVGGFSGATHRHGCQADNVHDLDVVTPDGELLTCSPKRDADLFDAVRGSQGQYGIITRATLALAPAASTARRYLLTYHDLGPFLADQRRLVDDRRFDYVGGQVRYVDGEGWRYLLEAVSTFDPPAEPDDRALLGDLGYDRDTAEIDTGSYGDFLRRAAAMEAAMRSAGSWQRDPHPRCNLLLPGRHAEAVIGDVLGSLGPQDIGTGGGVMVYPFPTARIVAPNVARAQDPVTVLFGVQRTAPPDDPQTLDRMRRANAVLRARVTELGGAAYAYPTAFHDAREAASGRPAPEAAAALPTA
ncbi:FAD-binding protein [Micromonospora sp. NPDC049523]|uniref:FAD-binding protein n=1 Tax=Micromonospora sp. NPDC049523 TaxID=3155921 RepID=UPI00342798F3